MSNFEYYLIKRQHRYSVDAIIGQEIIGLLPVMIMIIDVEIRDDQLLLASHPPVRCENGIEQFSFITNIDTIS